MKKLFLSFAVIAAMSMVSCGSNEAKTEEAPVEGEATEEVVETATEEATPAEGEATEATEGEATEAPAADAATEAAPAEAK